MPVLLLFLLFLFSHQCSAAGGEEYACFYEPSIEPSILSNQQVEAEALSAIANCMSSSSMLNKDWAPKQVKMIHDEINSISTEINDFLHCKVYQSSNNHSLNQFFFNYGLSKKNKNRSKVIHVNTEGSFLATFIFYGNINNENAVMVISHILSKGNTDQVLVIKSSDLESNITEISSISRFIDSHDGNYSHDRIVFKLHEKISTNRTNFIYLCDIENDPEEAGADILEENGYTTFTVRSGRININQVPK
ncbi:hypothetical protein [Candidatus Sororendozoicomonas aggregata]|uniref:hypothetical protein n=1 Tax=Candidatus Sororendozoicomonas aggregata TaxID=3073239 RepID=UPI002ED5A1FF